MDEWMQDEIDESYFDSWYAPTHCSCGNRLMTIYEQNDGICDICYDFEHKFYEFEADDE